ncbi:hypothetical protein, partial [Salmonella enterica]|uniref:hypothetical protein n=1 Tax=Salmonella enterica TaxID=28901 RepID=UPI003297C0E5
IRGQVLGTEPHVAAAPGERPPGEQFGLLHGGPFDGNPQPYGHDPLTPVAEWYRWASFAGLEPAIERLEPASLPIDDAARSQTELVVRFT